MSERQELIAELLKVTWPDGGHEGLPTKKTAGMLADGLLASGWLASLVAELARRDEQMAVLLEDFDYAYDKMAHGAPAAMHDLASRLLDGGAS